MAFLTVGEEPNKSRRLYLMEITMPAGDKVTKIGVASGTTSVDRMLNIVRDFFMKYRVTPRISIKRDREVDDDKVFKYETILHKFFSEYQYCPIIPFTGSTELFDIPIDDAVQAYELVIEGEVPDFTYRREEDIIPF